MESIATEIADIKILEPDVIGDERGFFLETFHARKFAELCNTSPDFKQDNHSHSGKGILRGLHYQVAPHAQAKLVRVVIGSVFDVAVDLRQSSPTFGKWVGVELSADNKRQLWIPEGFAHGFMVLSNEADVLYKTNNFYNPESERCIIWNDPDIGIKWPLDIEPLVSGKDMRGLRIRDAEQFR